MRIINRYILAEASIYFTVSLFAFTGVLLIARILRFTNLIVNKGVEARQIGMVFLAIIPTFLEVALPMATLLGVMMAFGRLSGDSEIVVMRASGISLRQLVRPVVMFGICATLLCLAVTIELRPWGYRRLADTLFEIARSKSTAGLEDGMFNKLGRLTLYSEGIRHQTGQLTQVLIDDRRNVERRQVIFAQHGLIISDQKARVINIRLYNGVIHEVVEGRYGITDFSTNQISLSVDDMYDPDAKKENKDDHERSLVELQEQLKDLRAQLAQAEETGGKPLADLTRRVARARVEYGRRFSMPFAAFLLALIAMPLGIQPPRAQKAWGATLSITLAMVVFVFYYGLMSIGLALAESGVWHPLVGLWLPNAAVALLAVGALWQMGTERWQSIAQAFESVFKVIGRLFGPRGAGQP